MSIIHSPAAACLQLVSMRPFKVTSVSGKWLMDPQTILTVYTYLTFITEIVQVFSAHGMKNRNMESSPLIAAKLVLA